MKMMEEIRSKPLVYLIVNANQGQSGMPSPHTISSLSAFLRSTSRVVTSSSTSPFLKIWTRRCFMRPLSPCHISSGCLGGARRTTVDSMSHTQPFPAYDNRVPESLAKSPNEDSKIGGKSGGARSDKWRRLPAFLAFFCVLEILPRAGLSLSFASTSKLLVQYILSVVTIPLISFLRQNIISH